MRQRHFDETVSNSWSRKFAAADTVLARGERPTVERVRLELCRGSPARVGGLLDQWWELLAGRLRGETRLPGLPAKVAQAFVAIWQQATILDQGVSARCCRKSVNSWPHWKARACLDAAHARQQTVARYLRVRDGSIGYLAEPHFSQWEREQSAPGLRSFHIV